MHYYFKYPIYCRDCGIEMELQKRGGPRLRCEGCRALHLVDKHREQGQLYRQRHPDRLRASRKARYLRDKAAGKYKSRAERQAESRKRAEVVMPKILALLKKGLSFAEVGPRLGLTRNAVAGLVHRNRKWEAAQGAQK